jgi:glycosyltransferase involved in cell wall biosynthesis
MTLWFLVDSMRWTSAILAEANTPALGGGIGGAEALLIGLAQRLAAFGHDVTIWATQCEGPRVYQGVTWRAVETGFRQALLNEPSPDLLVSVRRPEVFSLPEVVTGYRGPKILWAQDILDDRQGLAFHLQNLDVIVYMSRWHQHQWETVHPAVARKRSWITPSAFDCVWIQAPAHLRHRFIYASRPERGLLPLLAMWPMIKAKLPLAELVICGYSIGVETETADRLIARTQDRVGGIEIRRALDKPGFFAELAQARLMLYPGITGFTETNGHVASDAMAAGVIPLLSRRGALPETVPDTVATFFDGDPHSATYQEAFVSEALRLASPDADEEIQHRQSRGQAWVMGRCEYALVAERWHQALRTFKEPMYAY